MIRQPFPESEAKAAGAKVGDMLGQFVAPVLLFLLLIHAMVGYVELGTDSWISKITGGVALVLTFCIMLYDAIHKRIAFAPVLMGAMISSRGR